MEQVGAECFTDGVLQATQGSRLNVEYRIDAILMALIEVLY